MNRCIEEFTRTYLKKKLAELSIGDTIEVRIRIVEGEKERIQKFTGTLMARGGRGVQAHITVRRMVQGEGVECVFPLHSPKIDSIAVVRHGRVRRAKLYFLRERVGKAVKVQERRPHAGRVEAEAGGTEEVAATRPAQPASQEVPAGGR
ncbi:MAG: 50S ribosomal protein L19 [Planctomycetes bacterium]|nr:50S ribosomal protein L19 [Planctomycetota bacterium]